MSTDLKYELFEEELLQPLRGHELTPNEEFVASLLLDATSARPMQIRDIRQALHRSGRSAVSTRMIKHIVRKLKKHHEFPILSRREKPAGFWWCGSEAEMDDYIPRALEQPMDELHTLSRIVKANYPRLAGQLRLEETQEK